MHRCSFTSDFELARPVAEVFPLFSPEGEKLWVPGWDYHNVMGSTELAEDYVFLTRTHDHAASDAVWVVKRYAPASHSVTFYKIEPGEKVGLVSVHCAPLGAARTRVEVSYTYTGISPAGNRFVDTFTAQDYENFIGEWQRLLADYFAQQP